MAITTEPIVRGLMSTPWWKNRAQSKGMGLLSPGSGTQLDNQNPFVDSTPVTPASSIAGAAFQPLMDRLKGLGPQTIAEYTPLAPQFAGMAPVPVRRPDPAYFENLFKTQFSPVEQDYFGQGGVSDQAIEEANRRGFLTAGPSGVAGQLYSKTVSEPFARAATDVQNKVNVIRGELDQQFTLFDATERNKFTTFMADLRAKDEAAPMERAVAQANIDNQFYGLQSEIASAIATGTTEEELQRLERNLKAFETINTLRISEAELAFKKTQSDRELREKERAARAEEFITGMQIPGFYDQYPFEATGMPRPSSGPGSAFDQAHPSAMKAGVGESASAGRGGAPNYAPPPEGAARGISGAPQQVQGPDGSWWLPGKGVNAGSWTRVG